MFPLKFLEEGIRPLAHPQNNHFLLRKRQFIFSLPIIYCFLPNFYNKYSDNLTATFNYFVTNKQFFQPEQM